jgi:hypothetical protein
MKERIELSSVNYQDFSARTEKHDGERVFDFCATVAKGLSNDVSFNGTYLILLLFSRFSSLRMARNGVSACPTPMLGSSRVHSQLGYSSSAFAIGSLSPLMYASPLIGEPAGIVETRTVSKDDSVQGSYQI